MATSTPAFKNHHLISQSQLTLMQESLDYQQKDCNFPETDDAKCLEGHHILIKYLHYFFRYAIFHLIDYTMV